MSSNDVRSIRDTLDELILLHELSVEFLDALGIATVRLMAYVKKNDIPFDESLSVALQRVLAIYEELLTSKTVINPLKESIRRKFTDPSTRRRLDRTFNIINYN